VTDIRFTKSSYLENTSFQKIKNLEEVCSKHDQIFFKFELDYKLRDAIEKQKKGEALPNNDFFCYQGDNLIGYAGIDSFGDGMPEVSGVILPEFRRKRLFSKLIDSVETELRSRGHKKYLLLTDANSFSGKGFIQTRNGIPYQVEIEMELPFDTAIDAIDDSVELVLATNLDAQEISRQNRMFLKPEEESNLVLLPEEEVKRGMEIYLAKYNKNTIGKIHLQFQGDSAWIFGFILAPAFRGKHLGRAVLHKSIQLMRNRQIKHILLQVDSKNLVAHALYRQTGFRELYAMEYYEMKINKVD